MNPFAQLILIPTPLCDEEVLHPSAFKLLKESEFTDQAVICVEDHKVARRKWIKWGLDRKKIDQFRILNEHSSIDDILALLRLLKENKKIYLMSDTGLPCISDPGTTLVDECHKQNIIVSSTSFCQSFTLALALSGHHSEKFRFYGHFPKSENEYPKFKHLLKTCEETLIFYDTPYRLRKITTLLAQWFEESEYFLAMDLGTSKEELARNTSRYIAQKAEAWGKNREYVIVWPSSSSDKS